MRPTLIRHEFIEEAPEALEEGVLYISIAYRTSLHLCCCGCGNQVVLPLRPTAWRLAYDGETVSIWPSIGNWSFACRSHYWIRDSRIEWASDWTADQVAAGHRYTLEARRGPEWPGAPRPWWRRRVTALIVRLRRHG